MLKGDLNRVRADLGSSLTKTLQDVYAGDHNINFQGELYAKLVNKINMSVQDIVSVIIEQECEDVPETKIKGRLNKKNVLLIIDDHAKKLFGQMSHETLARKRTRQVKSKMSLVLTQLQRRWKE